MTTKDIERFWSKVDRNGPIPKHRPELGPCWIFHPATAKDGYGQFTVKINGEFVPRRAHRISYELAYSPQPPEVLILHSCDNRPCVNPSHLFLGTQQDNVRDRVAKGRSAVGDKSGRRIHPELFQRGDEHWSRRRPDLITRGEKQRNSKLTEGLVRKIRELSTTGLRHKDIGTPFGVSRATVWMVISGKAWKHVK